MILILLAASAFAAATTSATFGMAGGTLLIAVYALVLPVPEAMVLHGTTQLIANSSRMVLFWRHIAWRPLGGYVVGVLAAVVIATQTGWALDRADLFLVIGALALGLSLLRPRPWLSIQAPGVPWAAGLLVASSQLLAGVAGPLLDVFFLSSGLDRRAVVGTKSVTSALGHLAKVIVFAGGLGGAAAATVPPVWILVTGLVAVVGSRVGKGLNGRLGERRFRLASRGLIWVLGALCVVKGLT